MPIATVVEISGFEERPAPAVESTAFFVTAEAMVNAVKHAHARELIVTLARVDERLLIAVRDDGIGGATTAAGGGIRSMTDRVEALGGSLRIKSAVGAGTLIEVELPCAS
jgi:signal transduction histidine kinase